MNSIELRCDHCGRTKPKQAWLVIQLYSELEIDSDGGMFGTVFEEDERYCSWKCLRLGVVDRMDPR